MAYYIEATPTFLIFDNGIIYKSVAIYSNQFQPIGSSIQHSTSNAIWLTPGLSPHYLTEAIVSLLLITSSNFKEMV
jgi:hypothetical protein